MGAFNFIWFSQGFEGAPLDAKRPKGGADARPGAP